MQKRNKQSTTNNKNSKNRKGPPVSQTRSFLKEHNQIFNTKLEKEKKKKTGMILSVYKTCEGNFFMTNLFVVHE